MSEPNRARLLLVDQDTIVLESLGEVLRAEGYAVQGTMDPYSAMEALRSSQFDVIIAEVSVRTGNGCDLVRQATAREDAPAVILMAGYGATELAVEALKEGACEYVTKPVIDDDLRMVVRRALQRQQLLAENRRLKQAVAAPSPGLQGAWVGETLADALAEPEKQIIRSALAAHSYCRKETARSLGIDRTTLYKKMRKYGLLDSAVPQAEA